MLWRRNVRSIAAQAVLAAAFLPGALLAACQARPEAVTPGAQAVHVSKSDPPASAKNLGPIEVVHGHGCGLNGAKGSYDSAEAELRNQAEERGGDYVQITKVTEPHVEGGCYDERFTIRGVVFRVNPALVEAEADVDAAAAPSCVPPCSPGYRCESGSCRAECNPVCALNETCGQDRTCRPTSP